MRSRPRHGAEPTCPRSVAPATSMVRAGCRARRAGCAPSGVAGPAMALPTGLEPVSWALRGPRPRPLDDGSANRRGAARLAPVDPGAALPTRCRGSARRGRMPGACRVTICVTAAAARSSLRGSGATRAGRRIACVREKNPGGSRHPQVAPRRPADPWSRKRDRRWHGVAPVEAAKRFPGVSSPPTIGRGSGPSETDLRREAATLGERIKEETRK